MYESNDKMVSHPDHYQSGNGLEVIDVIEAFTADLVGAEAVCVGNALKYICRYKKKNGVQDIKKSIWYLTHLLEKLEKKNEVFVSPPAKSVKIVDSEGAEQELFDRSLCPYITDENDRTFTLAWTELYDSKPTSRVYSKPGFKYIFV